MEDNSKYCKEVPNDEKELVCMNCIYYADQENICQYNNMEE